MRSLPSSPTVSGAVRVLLRRSFHRAWRSPLRTKISAPGGRGLVVCFLNTVPTVHLPFRFGGVGSGPPVLCNERGYGLAFSVVSRQERLVIRNPHCQSNLFV